MVTPEQATDIREFLIKELNSNGFSEIVTEVNTRLEEDYEGESFERKPQFLLNFFLTESINILEDLSNKNYEKLMSRLNDVIQGETRIDQITVELLDDGEQRYYDLKDLPSYDKIISTFSEIIREINKENLLL